MLMPSELRHFSVHMLLCLASMWPEMALGLAGAVASLQHAQHTTQKNRLVGAVAHALVTLPGCSEPGGAGWADLGIELDGPAQGRGARQEQNPLGDVPGQQGSEELRSVGRARLQRVRLVADDHAEVALVALQLLRQVVGGDDNVPLGWIPSVVQLLLHILHPP